MASNSNPNLTVFAHLPVTALRFLDSRWLVAGEGCRLSLYRVDSPTGPEAQLELPRDFCVHGVRTAPAVHGAAPRLLAFGVRHFAVCTAAVDPPQLSLLGHICTLWDQVLDAAILEEDLFLITAHNRVLCGPWRQLLDGSSFRVVACETQCILYSALFIPLGAALVVAAGTVFNSVLLWRPRGAEPSRAEHCLTAHKGVIFGIDFDAASNRLASVSDDRTIAVWRGEAQAEPERGWSQFHLLARFFAHEARVWSAALLPWGLASVGEDCHLRLWAEVATDRGEKFRKVRDFVPHRGRGIWSLAVDPEQSVIASGGNDGAIFLQRLEPQRPSLEQQKAATVLPAQEDDFPRTLFYGADSCLHVMMNSGLLLARSSAESPDFRTLADLSAEFSKYCALSVNPDRTSAVFGALNGLVKAVGLCEGSQLVHLWERRFDGRKVMATVMLERCALVSLSDGAVVRLNAISGETLDQFLLPAAKKFRWMTAALSAEEMSLLGDREGRLSVFRSGEESCASSVPAHGRLGVTDLRWLHEAAGSWEFASAGKNGVLRVWRLRELELEPLREFRNPGDLSWIDKILSHRGPDSSLQLCGFLAAQLRIVDLSSGHPSLQLDCGGGHRAWDLAPSGSAAFIARGEVREFDPGERGASAFLKGAWHGRESNCCAVFGDGPRLELLIGSEDTALSSCVLPLPIRPGLFPRPCIQRFAFHISSVRCMTSARCGGSDWLFSAGGRGMLVAWRRSRDAALMPVTSFFASGGPRRKDLEHADIRVMAISARPDGEAVLLALACSDGAARVLHFRKERFRLLHVLPVSANCLLSCLLAAPFAAAAPALLLTASTDGHLRGHLLPPSGPALLFSHRVPASGALNCLSAPRDDAVLLCGGDNGCLHAWRLPHGPGASSGPAHAAAITAVAWEAEEAGLALSLGSDQRLRRWRVAAGGGLALRPLQEVLLGAADPHDLAVLRSGAGNLVAVVGIGVEILQLGAIGDEDKEALIKTDR